MSDYLKRKDGVVINTNKSALYSAKKRQNILRQKNAKIDDLEKRLLILEELILSKVKG